MGKAKEVKKEEKAHKREISNKKRIQELEGAMTYALQQLAQVSHHVQCLFQIMEKSGLIAQFAEEVDKENEQDAKKDKSAESETSS